MLPRILPKFARRISALSRSVHAAASVSPKALQCKPHHGIHTPAELMAVSLRPALQSLAPKLPSTLNEFLRLSGSQLSELGTMTVKERRYLLWLREKFRLGYDPTQIAIPPTPKKKTRGWGPAVQDGKRIK